MIRTTRPRPIAPIGYRSLGTAISLATYWGEEARFWHRALVIATESLVHPELVYSLYERYAVAQRITNGYGEDIGRICNGEAIPVYTSPQPPSERAAEVPDELLELLRHYADTDISRRCAELLGQHALQWRLKFVK